LDGFRDTTFIVLDALDELDLVGHFKPKAPSVACGDDATGPGMAGDPRRESDAELFRGGIPVGGKPADPCEEHLSEGVADLERSLELERSAATRLEFCLSRYFEEGIGAEWSRGQTCLVIQVGGGAVGPGIADSHGLGYGGRGDDAGVALNFGICPLPFPILAADGKSFELALRAVANQRGCRFFQRPDDVFRIQRPCHEAAVEFLEVKTDFAAFDFL
jgi:hypothetical protein